MSDSDKNALLHKEIDLIQSCITRMAQNSFTIKGWYFALIIVISAWKFDKPMFYGFTLLMVTFIFYVLNMQFYIYERRFRKLYSERIELRCIQKNYVDELYSLKLNEEKIDGKILFTDYIFKNKMLAFMYFGICVLLILANIYIYNEKIDGKISEDNNIKIEIKGLKNAKE